MYGVGSVRGGWGGGRVRVRVRAMIKSTGIKGLHPL